MPILWRCCLMILADALKCSITSGSLNSLSRSHLIDSANPFNSYKGRWTWIYFFAKTIDTLLRQTMIELCLDMLTDLPNLLRENFHFFSIDDTVGHVKNIISEVSGYPESTLRITYGDSVLFDDSRSLQSYGLPDGSRINAVQHIDERKLKKLSKFSNTLHNLLYFRISKWSSAAE